MAAFTPPPLPSSDNRWKIVNGTMVMEALGLPPGPLIGEILKELDEVLTLGEVTDAAGALAH